MAKYSATNATRWPLAVCVNGAGVSGGSVSVPSARLAPGQRVEFESKAELDEFRAVWKPLIDFLDVRAAV